MAIDDRLAEVRERLDYLEAMGRIHIPTLAEAYSGEWELAPSGVLEGIESAYIATIRGPDSTRIMSMKVAQQVLTDFEARLVDDMVLKGTDLVVKRVTRLYTIVKWMLEHPDEIWEAMKQAASADDLLEFIILYGIELVAISEIKKTVKAAMKARDEFGEKVKKRAFPQRSGKRYWRTTQTTK